MTQNADAIREALEMMDAADDEQWTNDGLPKVDVIAEATGIEGLKRKDITDAAPLFNRENPKFEASDDNSDAADAVDPEQDAQDDTPAAPDPADASDETSDEDEDDADAEGGDDEDEDEEKGDAGDGRVAVDEYGKAHNHPDVVAASERLKEATDAKAKADAEYQAAGAHHTKVMNKYVLRKTPQQNQKTIQDYLKSSHAQRVKRAEDAAKVNEALGVVAKAPIDEVAARKLGHGRDRKVHPNMNKQNQE